MVQHCTCLECTPRAFGCFWVGYAIKPCLFSADRTSQAGLGLESSTIPFALRPYTDHQNARYVTFRTRGPAYDGFRANSSSRRFRGKNRELCRCSKRFFPPRGKTGGRKIAKGGTSNRYRLLGEGRRRRRTTNLRFSGKRHQTLEKSGASSAGRRFCDNDDDDRQDVEAEYPSAPRVVPCSRPTGSSRRS